MPCLGGWGSRFWIPREFSGDGLLEISGQQRHAQDGDCVGVHSRTCVSWFSITLTSYWLQKYCKNGPFSGAIAPFGPIGAALSVLPSPTRRLLTISGSGPPSQYTAFQPRRVALRFARSDELNSPAPKPSRSSASSIASLRKFYFLALPPRSELCPPVWYHASWGGMCVQLSTPPSF